MTISTRMRRAGVLVSVGALCAAGLVALSIDEGAAAPPDILHAAAAAPLTCAAQAYPQSGAVDERSFTSTVAGIVQARLTGSGDWDLAVFDADTGDVVAGSAGFHTNELAEGFVTSGQHLLVQGCRFRGPASTARLSIEFFADPRTAKGGGKAQLVSVHTPTRADRTKLQALDLDLAEAGTATTVDVLLHGDADVAALRKAGLTYTVRIADLAAQSKADRADDSTYAASTPRSSLPSGRTRYRYLWDYELEMKRLSIEYPNLVKTLTLPNRTIEGRSVEGIELTTEARKISDGKPVFLDLGLHHAREWPAGEHAMEFAYDLLHRRQHNSIVAAQFAAARTIIVPVVNPDGFNISRTAPSIGGDFSTFDYEYKRKNCRQSDSPRQYRGGTCGANPAGRLRGTDLNRDYGGFWGGSGASPVWSDDTYRGARPFAEPETRNIRNLISNRQVTTLITNHTYSGLVLRPPGVYDVRPPLEDGRYERLGGRLASHNGYTNEPSWQLYDTTGSTEDWSYWATGGFGFTFEIGRIGFHPSFQRGVVAEYLGLTPALGAGHGGNRAAYYSMLAATADPAMHSTILGSAPQGRIIRVHKQFKTPTSPVIQPDGSVTDPLMYTDILDTTYTAPGGRFRMSVNPSTRPYVAGRLGREPLAPPQNDIVLDNPAGVPAVNTGNPLSGPNERIPFRIGGLPDVDNGTADITIRWASPNTDWDLYVVNSAGRVVASSANGGTTFETARFVDPPAGRYVAVVVNYDGGARDDWGQGAVHFASPLPTTYGPTETWTMTCEDSAGQVDGVQQVFVARGQVVDVGQVCTAGAGKTG